MLPLQSIGQDKNLFYKRHFSIKKLIKILLLPNSLRESKNSGIFCFSNSPLAIRISSLFVFKRYSANDTSCKRLNFNSLLVWLLKLDGNLTD